MEKHKKWILISSIINLSLGVLFSFILIIINWQSTNVSNDISNGASDITLIILLSFGGLILFLLIVILNISFINSIIILASDWKDKKLNDSKILLGILALFFGPIPAIIFGAQKPLEKELPSEEEKELSLEKKEEKELPPEEERELSPEEEKELSSSENQIVSVEV